MNFPRLNDHGIARASIYHIFETSTRLKLPVKLSHNKIGLLTSPTFSHLGTLFGETSPCTDITVSF